MLNQVTKIQPHPDGITVRVVIDDAFVRDMSVAELLDDVAINKFKEDVERSRTLTKDALARHTASNVLTFGGGNTRRPLGLAALNDDGENLG